MLVRTNIYLPFQTISLLKANAGEENKTMAELIREILEKTIKQNKANWAKSLLGLVPKAGKSGLRDLAQKHDVYLYRKK